MKAYITKDAERYERFMLGHPMCHFTQSPDWGKVKAEWEGVAFLCEDDGGAVVGGLYALLRKAPFMRGWLMMSSRGPVCDVGDGEVLRCLLRAVRDYAASRRCYAVTLEPDVAASDLAFTEAMEGMGYKVRKRGANFEGINPRFVYRLGIAGKDADAVMAGFHQKWRYNIRLAERKGVEVRLGGAGDVPAFHRIMEETGRRDGFVTRSAEYFGRMHAAMAHKGRMRLYLAYYGGELVAGTVTLMYGGKCWYLYGASSDGHRNVMATYLLQWEAIKWAIAEGCRVYDFRGVSGDMDEKNPLYGIYRFKKGFNGELVELQGQMDLVLRPFTRFAVGFGFAALRKARTAFRRMKGGGAGRRGGDG